MSDRALLLFRAGWMLWLMVFLILQFYALGVDRRATLTQTVEVFTHASQWVRYALGVLLTWMIFHFKVPQAYWEAITRLF